MNEELVVWWSSRVPIVKAELYPVTSIKEAKQKIKELADRDLADSTITDNVGGLEYKDGIDWCEWYCDCGEDIISCECNEKKREV